MAVIDDNKEKIVQAGALPLYVRLLSREIPESVQVEATRGLWSLAFKCPDSINDEPECRRGLYFSVIIVVVVVVADTVSI